LLTTAPDGRLAKSKRFAVEGFCLSTISRAQLAVVVKGWMGVARAGRVGEHEPTEVTESGRGDALGE
jgi:hypothetical protein